MNYAFKLPNNDKVANTVICEFVNYVKENYPELSIVGIDNNNGKFDVRQGIQGVTKNSVISISSDQKYDVDWYPNEKAANADGVRVDGMLPMSWIEMDSFLKRFVNEKRKASMFANNSGMRRPVGMSSMSLEVTIEEITRKKKQCNCPACQLKRTIEDLETRKMNSPFAMSDRNPAVVRVSESNQFYTRIGSTVIPKAARGLVIVRG